MTNTSPDHQAFQDWYNRYADSDTDYDDAWQAPLAWERQQPHVTWHLGLPSTWGTFWFSRNYGKPVCRIVMLELLDAHREQQRQGVVYHFAEVMVPAPPEKAKTE